MSNDIYKILEGIDSIKSGHKDQVKGTDKPSKGEKKYDGPYTKHPFQGKLVGRKKAASRKRREDPNKNRRGPAKNVKTK